MDNGTTCLVFRGRKPLRETGLRLPDTKRTVEGDNNGIQFVSCNCVQTMVMFKLLSGLQ